MFLTTESGRIFTVSGENAVTIGSGANCEIRITGPGVESEHCRIERSSEGVFTITGVGEAPYFVNEKQVAGAVQGGENRNVPIPQSTRIRIGTNHLRAWDGTADGLIDDRLRHGLYALENDLHNAVLDKLRPLPPAADAREERQRVEEELERQFRNTRFDPDGSGHEFENYLALQSLSGMLISRIHGFGVEGVTAGTAGTIEGLLKKIEAVLELQSPGSAADKTTKVEALLHWVIETHPSFLPAELRRELAFALLREQLLDLMFGLGPIGDLMRLQDINEIMVLPSGHIFIERASHMQDSGRRMLSPHVSARIVERIITSQGRRIDQSSPMVDARVKEDGSRLNAIIEPVAVEGPALTIRRFSDRRINIADLQLGGMLPANVGEFLTACVLAKKNIIISGGTGTGKTTLLNALAARIPAEERIITIEDTAEMRLAQTHVITLQARPRNLEGKGEVTIRDLVRNALRMRPDRILVGECRGGETLDMLQAMNTGHAGSMTTIHANSAGDAVRRLETMALEADSKLPSRAIREQIASAIDVIIQIVRIKEVRKVLSVSEVVEFDEDASTVIVEEIFGYRQRRFQKSPISFGSLEFTGHVPEFYDELKSFDMAGLVG